MFTGIVEEIGTLEKINQCDGFRALSMIAYCIYEGLEIGSSVSLDGACHTVVEVSDHGFVVNSIDTTLAKTIASDYDLGSQINLERAVVVGSRLDGHFVQGHIDGTGKVTSIKNLGMYHLVDIRIPEEVTSATLVAGSVTINGVSLTINALPAVDICQVAIIPFTWDNTNMQTLAVGSDVNVEGDLIGKYLQKFQTKSGNQGNTQS